jgi:hypothetical protein
MSSFERRGLPIRDAIDSALDDVVGIEYFDCPKSTALLGGRVVGLPQPFIVFCHVIGGGLPRDVLRVARRLAELSSIAAERSLSDVVKRFASEELTRKQAAVRIVTRGLTDSWAAAGREVVRVLEGADGLNHAGIGSACRALRLGTHVGADGPSGAAAQELVAYAYFLVTVVDLFQSSTVADVLRPAVEEREGGSSIETLACARQAFALDLRGAWALVSRFRRSWGWPTIEFPTAPRIDFSGKPTG